MAFDFLKTPNCKFLTTTFKISHIVATRSFTFTSPFLLKVDLNFHFLLDESKEKKPFVVRMMMGEKTICCENDDEDIEIYFIFSIFP